MSLKFILFFIFLYIQVNSSQVNDRPIIGILSEEFINNSSMLKKSFITTPYVKFVETSGARAVPILIYQSEEYYQDILNKVNGHGIFDERAPKVLFPGGGDLLNSAGYGRAGKIIFDLAVQMNDRGDYFPVWGTCLGFELLNLAVSGKMWMKRCHAEDVSLNIDFAEDFERSRMFMGLSTELKNEMQRENLTIHLHHWCITPQNYSLSGLDKYFKVLALNRDLKNNTFVSIIEAFRYPFYGVTFHPEKVVFDWSPYSVPIPHTADAVKTSYFFGNFLVSEARKNFHKFPSKAEEDSSLIYNYIPQRDETGTDLSAQIYVFVE